MDDDRGLEYKVGRELFGKPTRMMVGVWIAQLPEDKARRFHATDFYNWSRQDPDRRNWVGPGNADLSRFESLGLIECVARDRAIWYRRIESPMWDVFLLLGARVGTICEPPDPEAEARIIKDLLRIYAQTGG